MKALNTTANKVLDVAERYTQTRGFNAFSYKDIQQEVGVKTSSIHYYFPTKQDLALNMTERYVERFRLLLESVASENTDGVERLRQLVSIYVSVLEDDRFCMCGMLASDVYALPEETNEALLGFFDMLERWIAQAVEIAQTQNRVGQDLEPKATAKLFLSALEGGMLIARPRKDPGYLSRVMEQTLVLLTV